MNNTEIWTNNTWANWLKDNNVPEETYCIVEVVGYPAYRGKKVIAIANTKTGEDLKQKFPKNNNKKYMLKAYYKNVDGNYSVSTWNVPGLTQWL